MMLTVEMYMIIAILLMTTTLGLSQSCLHYCNFLQNNSSIPNGCNCSLHNPRSSRSTTSKHIKTLNSGMNNASVIPRFFQTTTYEEINTSRLNTFNGTKNELLPIDTGEPIAENDSYNINYNKPRAKQHPLHVYLDLDVNPSENETLSLKEVQKMFENFQATEKSLSECINLHIYIFSKHNNTINKTNTNSGREEQHDNLSSVQQLTEIESKCDQPANIIKQSIYEIKHNMMSREDKTTEVTQNEQKVITDSYENTVVAQNTNNTMTGHPIGDFYNNYSVTTTPSNMIPGNTKNLLLHDTFLNDDDDNNFLYNNNLPIIKYNNITSPSSFYEDSTEFHKNSLEATDPTSNGGLRTTSNTDRVIFNENDMVIPRIITKELSNGSVVSVLDGYEKVPNSDFVSNKSTHANSKENNDSNTNPELLKLNIDKTVQSDNIHGSLYFSFGTKQIPARFIQQPDGKLDVAIDGFTMCYQMLEYNTSTFMNSLCECIVHKNCT